MVGKYGLEFESLGTEADFKACVSNADLWHPQRSFRHVFQSLCPVLKQQYQIHAERADSGDLIGITNCFGLGAYVAQDKLNVPVITLNLQPAVVWSDNEPPSLPGLFGPRWLKSFLFRIGERFAIDAIVCPFLNEWRRELDLPPVNKIARWWNSQFGVLCMFPDWYAKPQSDWPSNLMQTDFPLWNDRSEEPLPVEVEQFLNDGSPPVVFTPGSANLHGEAFFRAAVQACQTLNRRGILLTEYAESLPAGLPASVAHFPYVPLDRLLSRSAAFVHHGGIGSVSQAMLAGIPQVIMPLAHDQFDNAERIKRLGIGDSLAVQRFTGPRLARVLKPLLDSSAVAHACKQIATRLAGRNGLQLSADAIEKRVAEGLGESKTRNAR